MSWKTFTDNGKYWISTSNLSAQLSGSFALVDYTYETMVFPLADGEIQYGENVECLRTDDEDVAYLNHLKMFEKYNNL
jgi:hypothetical protein